jgi:hypothetical protein
MDKEKQRQEWRQRQQRSRRHRAEDEAAEEFRTWAANAGWSNELTDFWLKFTAEYETRRSAPAATEAKQSPVSDDDLEQIKARSDAFDREKERCERKSQQESKRTLYALTHNMPVGWASLYPEQFPPELR